MSTKTRHYQKVSVRPYFQPHPESRSIYVLRLSGPSQQCIVQGGGRHMSAPLPFGILETSDKSQLKLRAYFLRAFADVTHGLDGNGNQVNLALQEWNRSSLPQLARRKFQRPSTRSSSEAPFSDAGPLAAPPETGCGGNSMGQRLSGN
jgi:hypothetical protein